MPLFCGRAWYAELSRPNAAEIFDCATAGNDDKLTGRSCDHRDETSNKKESEMRVLKPERKFIGNLPCRRSGDAGAHLDRESETATRGTKIRQYRKRDESYTSFVFADREERPTLIPGVAKFASGLK